MVTLIIGYFLFLLVGFSLGLLGGGGSILTVPVLAYIFGYEATTATYMSLFIVGTTSLVASLNGIRQKQLDFNSSFRFGLPSIISVILTRIYIIPAIPQRFEIFGMDMSKSKLLLTIFIIIMIAAAIYMIIPKKEVVKTNQPITSNQLLLILQGLLVGVVTGMVGAGGGFLIVPALLLFANLPMKKAIPTSLFIIAINTLFGFISGLDSNHIEWNRLLPITGVAVLGAIPGLYFASSIKDTKSKTIFGYFILLVGVIMIFKEFIL